MKTKNFFAFLILYACSSLAEVKKSDPLKELFISLGTVDAENLMLKNEYTKMKEKHPDNIKYIECLEAQLSFDSTAEYLRPYFMKIFTIEDIIIYRDFVKTKTGIKYVELSKNPSKYSEYKSIFNESEQKELNKFSQKLGKYFTKENGQLMRSAASEAGMKIYKDSDAKCSSLTVR